MGKKGINSTKEEDYIKYDRYSMWPTAGIGEAVGTHCCGKCEEIVHLKIVVTRLKERTDIICSKEQNV